MSIPGGRNTLSDCSMCSLHQAAKGCLQGIPISAGYVEGPIRVIRSAEEVDRVRQGDILVMPVIDPGWAPLLSLAGGLIVEMGGTLSHGAIIAREYGLPALVNVENATDTFRDGEQVAVDATHGQIRRLVPNPPFLSSKP